MISFEKRSEYDSTCHAKEPQLDMARRVCMLLDLSEHLQAKNFEHKSSFKVCNVARTSLELSFFVNAEPTDQEFDPVMK